MVVDLAISHTSDQHAWFKESRSSRDNAKADWYVWADAKPDGTPPNNWLSIFGGSAWTWDTRRCQYYMHNFLSCQPDLNIANPAVQDALLADLEFWLKLGVDGIRLDACNYYICNASLQDNPARPVDAIAGGDARPNNPYFWQWHIHDKSQPENLAFLGRVRALLNRYPGSFTVAEVGDDDQVARSAEYVAGDNRLHTAYSFALLGPSYSPGFIRNSLQEFRAHAGEEGWPSWSFSNHDVPRAVSRWARQSPSPDQAKLLIALLGALRGTVFMYQGEELGLPEAEIAFEDLQDPYGITFWPDFKGRDGCRTPMPWVAGQPNGGFSVGGASAGKPWLPVPAEHLPLAVDRQQADPASVLAFARAHLAWRRAQPALKTGTERFLDSAEPLLLVERKHPAQTILAAFNFENCTASAVLDLPDGAHVIRAHGARLEGRSAHFSPFGFLFLSLPQTEA